MDPNQLVVTTLVQCLATVTPARVTKIGTTTERTVFSGQTKPLLPEGTQPFGFRLRQLTVSEEIVDFELRRVQRVICLPKIAADSPQHAETWIDLSIDPLIKRAKLLILGQ